MNLHTGQAVGAGILELSPELQIRITPTRDRRSPRWLLEIRLYRRQDAADQSVYVPTLAGFLIDVRRAAELAGKVMAIAKGCTP